MSIFAYNNLNNNIEQLSDDIVPFGIFVGDHFDDTYYAPEIGSNGRPLNGQIDGEQELIKISSAGDVVVTSTLTNFSLDFISALRTVSEFYDKKVRVIAIQEDFDTDSPIVKSLLEALPMMLDFRRTAFQAKRARQIAGIQKAAGEGKYKGRQAYSPSDFPEFTELYRKYMFREIGKKEFAEQLNVSRPTLDRMLEDFTRKKGE